MNSNKRVLLVEDNEPTIEVVRLELAWMGYEVTIARDGLQAVESVVARRPDLILMDIQLPKLDGVEAVRRIREVPGGRSIPILAATAKTLEGDKVRCIEAGCDGYIAKPFTHIQLKSAIDLLFRPNPKLNETAIN